MLLAIDPGECTGWAVFDKTRRLIACGVGDPRSCHWTDLAAKVVIGVHDEESDISKVVIEKPRFRPHGGTKSAQDLITLAICAGEYGGYFARIAEIFYVEPSEWKGGSVEKTIQNSRDFARLKAEEIRVVDLAVRSMATGKRHNMIDAIGIGLFALGRGARRSAL